MTKPFTKPYDLYLVKRQAESVYREPVDMTIELDASKLTEPIRLVVKGARGTFTTTIDPDPSKPFGKAIDKNTVAEPHKNTTYQIYPSNAAQMVCGAKRFHEVVEQLTTLGVTGFLTTYEPLHNHYRISLGMFRTNIHPSELYGALHRIYQGFAQFTCLEVKDNA